jgi:hypothetical protein
MTIAGSVRSELLGPVARRGGRGGRRLRRRRGRRWRDVFGDGRRGRFDDLRVAPVRLGRRRDAAAPMSGADHRRRGRRVGDGPGTSRRRHPHRCSGRRLCLRQPDVGCRRWRLRRAQQPRQEPQADQADDDDRRHPSDPAPPDPHARHPPPRDAPSQFLPRSDPGVRSNPRIATKTANAPAGRRAQARAPRALAMSASWSSTQSPGLREKMISRRPLAHSAFCSGSMVRAR